MNDRTVEINLLQKEAVGFYVCFVCVRKKLRIMKRAVSDFILIRWVSARVKGRKRVRDESVLEVNTSSLFSVTHT